LIPVFGPIAKDSNGLDIFAVNYHEKILYKRKIILQSKRKNFLDLKSSCWEFDLEIEKKKKCKQLNSVITITVITYNELTVI
jgi:hypothetical protein